MSARGKVQEGFRMRHGVPYADAFAAALAFAPYGGEDTALAATPVTADNDFRGIPSGRIDVEFLPGT